MDKETIIKLAREAESPEWGDWFTDEDALYRFFNAAYAAGAAAEREACAKVCDVADSFVHPANLAREIRARGPK